MSGTVNRVSINILRLRKISPIPNVIKVARNASYLARKRASASNSAGGRYSCASCSAMSSDGEKCCEAHSGEVLLETLNSWMVHDLSLHSTVTPELL